MWEFVDSVRLPEGEIEVAPATCLAHIEAAVSHALPDAGEAALVSLELALRAHSPQAEIYAELAARSGGGDYSESPACCWADVAGQRITDPAALGRAIEDASRNGCAEEPSVYDYPYPPADGPAAGATCVALYAPIGSACGRSFHEVLRPLAAAGRLVYSWRPPAPAGGRDRRADRRPRAGSGPPRCAARPWSRRTPGPRPAP